MRLLPTLVGALACGCLAATPTLAGQRGQHSTPTPTPKSTPVHAAAPVHPATPAHPAAQAHPATPAHGAPPAHAANTSPHPAPTLIPQKITGNPALVARLQPLLPSGMTLTGAATGFRNQGQFIAALHVSQNLKIPFPALKAEMNGPQQASLGQAIHTLRPRVNSTLIARTAEREAAVDLKATTPAKAGAGQADR